MILQIGLSYHRRLSTLSILIQFILTYVRVVSMKIRKGWKYIAERLAESGWSWQHRTFSDRAGKKLHFAEAHDLDGKTHAVVADKIVPAFSALEKSINET
jgi:hypothetical protein